MYWLVVAGASAAIYFRVVYCSGSKSTGLRLTSPKALGVYDEMKRRHEQLKSAMYKNLSIFEWFRWSTYKQAVPDLIKMFLIEPPLLHAGQQAPDCTVVDLEGKESSLLSFAKPGRPLILNFGSYT